MTITKTIKVNALNKVSDDELAKLEGEAKSNFSFNAQGDAKPNVTWEVTKVE